MVLTKEEINRKLLHILSGTLIPAGIFYIPMVDDYTPLTPVVVLLVLTLGSLFLEFLRFHNPSVQGAFARLGSAVLRNSEKKRSLTGATYIFASAFICSVIFYQDPQISFIALSLFILGDAAAALVGIRFGRIRIGGKSLEGSAACFVLGLLLFFFVYPNLPLLLDRWNGVIPLPLILLASLTNTLFELFPIRFGRNFIINDNLTVPLITGMVMLICQPLFV